jgi:hypothetical protein
MIGVLVVALLIVLAGHNITDQRRFKPCLITMQLALFSYVLYGTPVYNWAVELLGYYQYQMIVPFVAILILRKIPGKLSTILMITAAVNIAAGCLAFWQEGFGLYTWEQYQLVVWILLAVELFAMFSPRLTRAIHGPVHGIKLARDSISGWCARDSLAYSAKNSASEAQK